MLKSVVENLWFRLMRRDCNFTVEVNKVESLRSCLEEVARQYVPGRWCPKIPEDWTDVWVSTRHCLDMAQARAYELNLWQEEESLAKLKRLLLVATVQEVRTLSVDKAGNMYVRCATEQYEPQECSNFQARVGSYHVDEWHAAAIDLGRLQSRLTTDKWLEEVQWIKLSVTHLEFMYFKVRRSR